MAGGNRDLKVSPFMVSEDTMTTGERWEGWLKQFERQLRFFKITDDADKKDAMLIYGGEELCRLDDSLDDPETGTVYEKLKEKLSDYFLPKKNVFYSRFLFGKMRPNPNESTMSYAARLREKAKTCEFDRMTTDDRILEHILLTTDNQIVVQKVLNKKMNLAETLITMQIHEDTSIQVSEMNQEKHDIAKVHNGSKSNVKQSVDQVLCKYCKRTHQRRKDACPAFGKTCNNCGKKNHFAIVCTSAKSNDRHFSGHSRRGRRQDVRRTGGDQDSDYSDDISDKDFLNSTVNHLKVGKIKNKINRVCDFHKTIPVVINDVIVHMEPDTGADVNVMDERQFRTLKSRSRSEIVLGKSKVKLSTLQSDLPVAGEFNAVIRNDTRGAKTSVIVVKGKINSPPLISKNTLIELGMLEIRPDGSLKPENDLSITKNFKMNAVRVVSSEIREILELFDDVFHGIGKIYDKKKNEEFLVKFSMKPDAVPVAQKPRHVPYYLQEPLRKWLDECIKEDIYEEVQQGEPITWCSPLVVQPKPRFADVLKDNLEPHMIRASVDLRIPNKYMERNRIMQAPIIEDFTCKFHDCKFFSKMDLRQGYHQLILHPDSRSIATFSTPWGNMRPKRLIFGAKASQDLFDEAMYRIFGDIPYCLNQRDDILIGGPTLESHNQTLKTVLQRARDFGVTLNKEKCQFGVTELEFYGYRFTNEGLKPTEDKVKAVKMCNPPSSKEEVRSFLGMIGYLSKFIPRYSVLTAPLRRLTGKNVPFSWGPNEEVAFQKLKDSITSNDTMAFFDPRKPIIVRTEASFHEGISAGLFQKTGRGLQPVHYISRSMSTAEKRYSQTEKDALAVKWAKSRFSMYLLGAPRFKIITSHKPLIPMFNRSCGKLPSRIEKWIMEMQDVDYDLIYEPGKDEADPMDYLSRHPIEETEQDDTEGVIKMIVHIEHGVVANDIREATEADEILRRVKGIMKLNSWEKNKHHPEIKPYYLVRHELYRAKGLIFRNNQIVIPEKLQKSIIKAAHSMGHFGLTKTKQMLRRRYWFPALNNMVENAISKCYQCQIASNDSKQEPVKPSEIPQSAWNTLSIDFGGPYPDGHYNLVVIDKRTRFPVVEQVRSTSFKTTSRQLQKIFATYGIPERIESDNGPPFNSIDFANFAEEYGFQHHRITPEHPRANGEAERFMRVLNKTEQIAHSEGKCSESEIQNMLMGYRSTPHPATGYTPYEALMRRNIRTKLDYPFDLELDVSKMEQEITQQDKEYKQKWDDQQRRPVPKRNNLRIGEKVLLKKKRENKWSTPFEREPYTIIGIRGSNIQAKRKSDGRLVVRDASKFKKFIENDDQWRERLLRIPEQRNPKQNNETNIDKNSLPVQLEPRSSNTERSEEITQETRDTHEPMTQPNRLRKQPNRLRRLPSRFKDFILEHKKR